MISFTLDHFHIRLETFFRALLGKKDIEDALKRLDGLIREEDRMIIAHINRGGPLLPSVVQFPLNSYPHRCHRNKVFAIYYFHRAFINTKLDRRESDRAGRSKMVLSVRTVEIPQCRVQGLP